MLDGNRESISPFVGPAAGVAIRQDFSPLPPPEALSLF